MRERSDRLAASGASRADWPVLRAAERGSSSSYLIKGKLWPLHYDRIPRPSELEWMSAAVANEEGMEAATPTRGRERGRE